MLKPHQKQVIKIVCGCVCSMERRMNEGEARGKILVVRIRGVIKTYGECCCHVPSIGKAGLFNTESVTHLSNSV